MGYKSIITFQIWLKISDDFSRNLVTQINDQYLGIKETQTDTLPIGKIRDLILNMVATGKAVMVVFWKMMHLMRILAVRLQTRLQILILE